MFTLLLLISTIQGCSNILHGVALLADSFSKLYSVSISFHPSTTSG